MAATEVKETDQSATDEVVEEVQAPAKTDTAEQDLSDFEDIGDGTEEEVPVDNNADDDAGGEAAEGAEGKDAGETPASQAQLDSLSSQIQEMQTHAAEAAAAAAKSPDEYDAVLQKMQNEEFSGETTKAFQELVSLNRNSDTRIQELEKRAQKAENDAFIGNFDHELAALGKTYQTEFGDGTMLTQPEDSKHYKNRLAVLSEVVAITRVDEEMGRTTTFSDRVARAVHQQFPGRTETKVRQEIKASLVKRDTKVVRPDREEGTTTTSSTKDIAKHLAQKYGLLDDSAEFNDKSGIPD